MATYTVFIYTHLHTIFIHTQSMAHTTCQTKKRIDTFSVNVSSETCVNGYSPDVHKTSH